jgi:hypothetical protein
MIDVACRQIEVKPVLLSMEFISVVLVLIWARLSVTRVHAAAQRSMSEAGRNGRKRSCAQPLTARTALVSFGQ